MPNIIKLKRFRELTLAGGRRLGGKLQFELCNLLSTVAQRLQHSHMTEIGYLSQLLESTHQELANCRLSMSPSRSEEIISQETELRELIQEYLISNQNLTHFLDQLSPDKLEGEIRPILLKQTWQLLKQFYCQQENKENQLISKYKEFQRRVKNLQKEQLVKTNQGRTLRYHLGRG